MKSTGRRVHRVLLCSSVLALACALTGCSLIGLGIGAKIDSSHKAPSMVLDGWDLERVAKGTRVRVVRRRSGAAEGVFKGLDVSTQEYDQRYESWRGGQAASGALPRIGDSITVEGTSGKVRPGAFLGFEYQSLAFREDGEAFDRHVFYRDISRVSAAGGGAWEGAQLSGLAAEGRLPLRSCMLLDKARIPLEDVSRVEVWRAGKTGKLVGFLLGAVVDGIVIAALVSDDSPPPPPPTYYSCPYAYSFDGRRYVEEGDVFPGALLAAWQRSDRLVLEHLAERDGTYRVRLTNRLPEVEHVDEVKLLVVDGPEGAVVPAPRGGFRVLASPLAPVKATDLRGTDVRDLVRASDGQAWVGSPLARDPEHPAEARDGLLLEFPRPAGARSVTLAFRVQPTPWASHLLREVLALQGAGLPAWYARMDRDAAAQAEFRQAYRREAQLLARVWNGASWQDAGVVNPHEAMELPLDGISGDVLRLRLESTAGLWSIDSVRADFRAGVSFEVLELSPVAARTRNGDDLRGLLGSADGHRHVMERGDSVDLVFEAPPPKSGRRRSFVLRAAGYYTVQVPADREAQPSLFSRLVQEPGALGRYGVDLLESDVARRFPPAASLADATAPAGR